ncbi:Nickel responsive regulator [Pyrodictium delaneyi]|uniref:Nickel responsive regulator n=1 Tax=Pyrodictium delaneyi TaxID=1273541 RepID=A0A0P0N338_9CREN|nr:CopG family ribbon-helix-helix protein [Pyrodictium delaneyi]ALL00976.1 Nickel responsive regulator [Pyrodictium delaneyi]OWJ55417.1 hypothetical protein Pdsh_01005 [Pyrodictium delaneyi]
MPIVSVSIPESLLEKVDNYVEKLGFVGRSELVREALRRMIEQLEATGEDRERRTWIIVTVTRHNGGSAADRRVIEAFHSHQPLVRALYHQLLDDNRCINIAVVEASTIELKPLMSTVRRIRGVERVWFIPI